MSIFLESRVRVSIGSENPAIHLSDEKSESFLSGLLYRSLYTICVSVGAIATDRLKSSTSLRQTIFGMKLIMIATEEWAFNQLPQHFLQAF